MLEDRIREWKAQYRREGLAAGRQEGIEEGIEQGLEQGSLREARTILRRQLTRRFGSVPAAVEDRMARASRDQLEQWIDQLYEAGSIDEIFHSPQVK